MLSGNQEMMVER